MSSSQTICSITFPTLRSTRSVVTAPPSAASRCINDIARADVAYAGFAALTGPFFRGSYITPDGLTSVRRSYTPEELRAVAPPSWQVSSPYPFRLLLSYGLDD